jgi:hypothetical protein
MVLRSLAILLVLSASAASASAQILTVKSVRVATDDARIMSRPSLKSEVMATPANGTVLETLDREGDWFWVLIGRDSHGTQRVGWIRQAELEGFASPADEDSGAANGSAAEWIAELLDMKAKPIAEVLGEAEKPKRIDDRRLRAAERKLEEARKAFERVQQQAGESIPEPAPQQ